jgi:hypothetical protein
MAVMDSLTGSNALTHQIADVAIPVSRQFFLRITLILFQQ